MTTPEERLRREYRAAGLIETGATPAEAARDAGVTQEEALKLGAGGGPGDPTPQETAVMRYMTELLLGTHREPTITEEQIREATGAETLEEIAGHISELHRKGLIRPFDGETEEERDLIDPRDWTGPESHLVKRLWQQFGINENLARLGMTPLDKDARRARK